MLEDYEEIISKSYSEKEAVPDDNNNLDDDLKSTDNEFYIGKDVYSSGVKTVWALKQRHNKKIIWDIGLLLTLRREKVRN